MMRLTTCMPKLRKLMPSGTLAALNSQSISSAVVSPWVQPLKSYVREGGHGCMSWDGRKEQVKMGHFWDFLLGTMAEIEFGWE